MIWITVVQGLLIRFMTMLPAHRTAIIRTMRHPAKAKV